MTAMITDAPPPGSYLSEKWDRASVFPTDDAWEAERARVESQIPKLATYAGAIGKSAEDLVSFLENYFEIASSVERVGLYAEMHHDEDTRLPLGADQYERSKRLQSSFAAATAFVVPELLAISDESLSEWYSRLPSLAVYRHFIDRRRRLAPHTRSAEVENVIASLKQPLANHFGVYRMLNESEAEFDSFVANGVAVEVTTGNIETLLASADREIRLKTWASYIDFYNRFARTYSECFAGEIRCRVALTKVRRYCSALEAALTPSALTPQVFDSTINAVRSRYPVWHRYWEIKRCALELEKISHADVFAPLSKKEEKLAFPQACETIIAAMAPLGEEYTTALASGLRSEGWIDYEARPGKRSNAYSSGAMGTKPFVLQTWDGSFRDFSTLAHEIGHSMHSHFTWKTQPWVYGSSDIFVAEVASNFNQAMVREHLLRTQSDPQIRLQVLEEAFSNLHRYLFWMPVLSQFELNSTVHVEAGGALTAPWLRQQMCELLKEAYGPAVSVTEDEVGMSWASFLHLYLNFYAFQYTTGISAAYSLALPILNGDREARDRYLDLLRAGGSGYSLELLKRAGVDLSTPKPIENTFEVLSRYLDEYERILGL